MSVPERVSRKSSSAVANSARFRSSAFLARHILWVDCAAGALVGVLLVSLSGWISVLYGLPRGLLVAVGAVNLLYASFSFSLAVRSRRPLRLIVALAGANFLWALVCLSFVLGFSASITMFGTAHLLGEAIFVTALAAVEWKRRHSLLVRGF